jgi:drug/metabolite transporter (DMT)-like permease
MKQEAAAVAPGSTFGGISAISFAAMLLLAVIWGLSIPVTKLALFTLPPLTLTALRFLLAAPLFLLLAIGQLRVPWRAVPSIAALGVMGISLGNVAQSFGIAGTSASVGTIISATIPIFVVVFAALRLKQPVTGRQWIGLLAAFAGIALVAMGGGSDAVDAPGTTMTGVAWMLVSAVAIAFYFVWSAELNKKFGTMPVTAWNGLAGLVAIVPFAAWEMTSASIQITAQVMWLAVYLAAAVTVFGLLLWLYLLRNVPARVAASVQYLQPVIGIASSALLFGDKLGILFFAGVALIFGGLALAVANRGPKVQTKQPSE